MPVLDNLKLLKEDMIYKGWVISSFSFDYENRGYIALVILYQPNEPKNKYGLLKIDFLLENDMDQHLLVEANSSGLLGDARMIREFFEIEYSDNLGDRLKSFYKHLGKFVPTEVPSIITATQKTAIVVALSHYDAEESTKVYCYKVKRNPKREDGTNEQRSSFNDNKTRILRPRLYNKLKDDRTLSFCYSEDIAKNKTDEEIISNWAKNLKSTTY